MTKKALEKLNEIQLEYCKTLSFLITHDRNRGAKEPYERSAGKLRGYLECMEQMGIISNSEMRGLYLWFFSENRA